MKYDVEGTFFKSIDVDGKTVIIILKKVGLVTILVGVMIKAIDNMI